MTDSAERLRHRYPTSRVPRWLKLSLGTVAALVAIAWLIWTATAHSRPVVAGQVAAFEVVSDTRIDITMTVDRRDPSLPVTCLLVAQAKDFDRVAEQNVRVEATAEPLVDVTISLTTLRRATSASVKGCDRAG